ncbi:uncharacterized protein BDR25DRAFT_351564 [Lindgomyces ingoldianus]|uniref:Uncharacterized protein n=1 Tax=Lindgomyces ingoldianus TaxID=673940 RepID=A0ACB6R449_9PLEO|nr:uncharacterized protein BDR25DRAFT_351564 [Lindgomyces ingoldianus]KAF2474029.1 hypothetical protein BDR25DRAFT_351564 [Lindgomyces ingoldianus]
MVSWKRSDLMIIRTLATPTVTHPLVKYPQIPDSLPLVVPINGAALHEIALCSAHRVDGNDANLLKVKAPFICLGTHCVSLRSLAPRRDFEIESGFAEVVFACYFDTYLRSIYLHSWGDEDLKQSNFISYGGSWTTRAGFWPVGDNFGKISRCHRLAPGSIRKFIRPFRRRIGFLALPNPKMTHSEQRIKQKFVLTDVSALMRGLMPGTQPHTLPQEAPRSRLAISTTPRHLVLVASRRHIASQRRNRICHTSPTSNLAARCFPNLSSGYTSNSLLPRFGSLNCSIC